jgi:catechol 2,3-dioxygenase-like lactoylglutathione lyase family enzyme
MFRAVMLGAADLERAGAFYDAVFKPLGWQRVARLETEIGFGPSVPGDPSAPVPLWILKPYDGGQASFGNGVNIAFDAPSRSAVDEFYSAALAKGGKDEGAPGLRLHYTPTFYAAYVRDPTGNKVSAVFDKPMPTSVMI